MNGLIGTDVTLAARLIARGKLVAFPTETVYGLGAHALDPHAVAEVFAAKQRPFFDPLIVHVATIDAAAELVAEFPDVARRLADRFWPGPLTLVLPKCDHVPDLVTAGLPNVAVRIPAHPLAQELLQRSGLPIAAPSANLFGQISPTTAEHVAQQLGHRVDYLLDGGPCRVGLESTVLHLAGEQPTLLRPGGVSVEELEAVLGRVTIPQATTSSDQPQLAPGMLERHYAPGTPLVVVEQWPEPENCVDCGVLSLGPLEEPAAFAAVEVLSPSGDLTEAAAGFYAALRRLDQAGVRQIVARLFPTENLGRALNDRLRRAAIAAEERS